MKKTVPVTRLVRKKKTFKKRRESSLGQRKKLKNQKRLDYLKNSVLLFNSEETIWKGQRREMHCF